jgi:hypothetical protein
MQTQGCFRAGKQSEQGRTIQMVVTAKNPKKVITRQQKSGLFSADFADFAD